MRWFMLFGLVGLIGIESSATEYFEYFVYFEETYVQGGWVHADALKAPNERFLFPELHSDLMGSGPFETFRHILSRLRDRKPQLYAGTYLLMESDEHEPPRILTLETRVDSEADFATLRNEVVFSFTQHCCVSGIVFRFRDQKLQRMYADRVFTEDDVPIPAFMLTRPGQSADSPSRAGLGRRLSKCDWGKPDCLCYDREAAIVELRIPSGMTLYRLAKTFSVSEERIVGFNQELSGHKLKAGFWYQLPIDHLEVIFYRVRRDDTLYRIAQKYRLPSTEPLQIWNCLPSSKIQIGDQLLVLRIDHRSRGR
ncbi:MAG: LysM peptidoglycan-binding domain-containing protein [bacterium]|nr:LysM peptidoglycan-binding domain-containing protein [bacterium]